MGSSQFCLRWNNHQNNLLTVFDDLLTTESFVDVTLACEGTAIKAHKVVLSACSSFFQELFKENPCKHPIVILKDVRYMDLKAIIKFMYKGEVNISQDQLPPLLKAADALRVKGLVEITQDQQLQVLGDNNSDPARNPDARPPDRPVIPPDTFIMTHQPIPTMFQQNHLSPKKPVKIFEKRSNPIATDVTPVTTSELVQSVAVGYKREDHQINNNSDLSPIPIVKSTESISRLPDVHIKGEIVDSPISTNGDAATDNEFATDNYPVFPESDINNSHPAFRITMTNDGISGQLREGDIQEVMDQTNLASTSENSKSSKEITGSMASYNRLFTLTQPDSKQFLCPMCNKTFNHRYNMKKHLIHFHAPHHVRYQCDTCPDKSFRWKEDLNKHMDKFHERRKRYRCPDCGTFFHHHWRMDEHRHKYHGVVCNDREQNAANNNAHISKNSDADSKQIEEEFTE